MFSIKESRVIPRPTTKSYHYWYPKKIHFLFVSPIGILMKCQDICSTDKVAANILRLNKMLLYNIFY